VRNLSDNFQKHLDGESVSICNCWEIECVDGKTLGFTDHDLDIQIGEIVFEASSGLEASQIEASMGLSPNNHEITGALRSDRITSEHIAARVYDGAKVRHYVVNWQSPDEHILMQTYLMGDISQQDGAYKVELKSLIALLDQTNTRKFEKRCNANLGDSQCGIDLFTNYSFTGVVVEVMDTDFLTIGGLPEKENGWFSGGVLEFTSGANIGKRTEITNNISNQIKSQNSVLQLWSMFPDPISVGDQVLVRPGCDKLLSTCYEKFQNVINFRGFPHLPSTEFAMSYAGNSKDLDGGPLVP